ncbi:PAAR domain-containing protein [Tropicimonas sp. IMCC34011]|uniref:PAAR domain-containing protein n=1 Tax=Tropicimonas sp. IMCC34011 TaxID=2248759 RepID=UPI000E2239EB|nr:PAAR domain-containing protein [Tropicimonas sp. IMCC34011]
MPPAARISDMHACPMIAPGPTPHVGGPVIVGSPNVITLKMPQARVGDSCICVIPMDSIAKGSATVHVNKRPAARLGDNTVHGGAIVTGAPTVIIGDAAAVAAVQLGAAQPCLAKAAKSGAAFVKA